MAQFAPGRSGNPKGRPRGARNLSTQFLAEVNAPAGSDPGAMTKLQAAIRAHVGKALEGDIRAIRDVLERVERLESDRSAERPPVFTDADRETVAEIRRRLAPEPDDVGAAAPAPESLP